MFLVMPGAPERSASQRVTQSSAGQHTSGRGAGKAPRGRSAAPATISRKAKQAERPKPAYAVPRLGKKRFTIELISSSYPEITSRSAWNALTPAQKCAVQDQVDPDPSREGSQPWLLSRREWVVACADAADAAPANPGEAFDKKFDGLDRAEIAAKWQNDFDNDAYQKWFDARAPRGRKKTLTNALDIDLGNTNSIASRLFLA